MRVLDEWRAQFLKIQSLLPVKGCRLVWRNFYDIISHGAKTYVFGHSPPELFALFGPPGRNLFVSLGFDFVQKFVCGDEFTFPRAHGTCGEGDELEDHDLRLSNTDQLQGGAELSRYQLVIGTQNVDHPV